MIDGCWDRITVMQYVSRRYLDGGRTVLFAEDSMTMEVIN